MKAGGNGRSGAGAETIRALRGVLIATGGHPTVRELYQVLSAEETAAFLNLTLQAVRRMTCRGELPVIRTGKRGAGYRVIDLIAWQEARKGVAYHAKRNKSPGSGPSPLGA
jgi:hypothetical protein